MIKLTPRTGVLLGLSTLAFDQGSLVIRDNLITLPMNSQTLSDRWAEAILNNPDFVQSRHKDCMYGTLCDMMGVDPACCFETPNILHLMQLAGIDKPTATAIYTYGQVERRQQGVTRQEAASYIRSLNLP